MKKEEDGFKILESQDEFYEAVKAMYDDILLLRKQIIELQSKVAEMENKDDQRLIMEPLLLSEPKCPCGERRES